jgi:formylglycine-generating enzyme required for sulfatase activity
MQKAEGAAIKLFYSYSHKDEELRNELAEHLFPLQRAGLIEVWHDREMLPGDTVDEEIAQKLRTADLVLVLVSPSFIRSEYCWGIELRRAIERHERGEARVVPVVLRPCQWQLTPLKYLLAMPTDGRAVTDWANRDTAFNDVANGIARLATIMRQKGSEAADPAAAGAKPAVSRVDAAAASTPPPPPPTPRPPADAGEGSLSLWERRGVRALADFAVFRDVDAPWCPEMVVIPAAQFLMGSPPGERFKNEGPQHRVTIGYRFAIGRYAVTFAEYDHFCEETNREKPADNGWGRGRRPVINVSWRDAQAYCEWLAKETDLPYRLPSEAEWEYACRAGTTTRYSWGGEVSKENARFAGWAFATKTTEVGTYPANPWGLHEMHGNVLEWVEDVWQRQLLGRAGGRCGLDGRRRIKFRSQSRGARGFLVQRSEDLPLRLPRQVRARQALRRSVSPLPDAFLGLCSLLLYVLGSMGAALVVD